MHFCHQRLRHIHAFVEEFPGFRIDRVQDRARRSEHVYVGEGDGHGVVHDREDAQSRQSHQGVDVLLHEPVEVFLATVGRVVIEFLGVIHEDAFHHVPTHAQQPRRVVHEIGGNGGNAEERGDGLTEPPHHETTMNPNPLQRSAHGRRLVPTHDLVAPRITPPLVYVHELGISVVQIPDHRAGALLLFRIAPVPFGRAVHAF